MKQFSGHQITRAGKDFVNLEQILKDDARFNCVMDVLSCWRLCHEKPLSMALETVRRTVSKYDKSALFAKRLKRYIAIYNKLRRFKHMTLRNMQDIGGCRAIISNEKRLTKSVRELRRMKEFRTANWECRAKDYIQKPKDDGYRGYHLIGRFPDESGVLRNIEVQLRTRIQHYWATALEIVDLFTGQALKSNQGDEAWKEFFVEVGFQFAIMDRIHLFHSMKRSEQLDRFEYEVRANRDKLRSCQNTRKCIRRLKVEKRFAAYAESLEVIGKQLNKSQDSGYVLLRIDLAEKQISSQVFNVADTQTAEANYIRAEKEAAQTADLVIALVASSAVGGVQEAYPNFFADSSEFVRLLSIIEEISI